MLAKIGSIRHNANFIGIFFITQPTGQKDKARRHRNHIDRDSYVFFGYQRSYIVSMQFNRRGHPLSSSQAICNKSHCLIRDRCTHASMKCPGCVAHPRHSTASKAKMIVFRFAFQKFKLKQISDAVRSCRVQLLKPFPDNSIKFHVSTYSPRSLLTTFPIFQRWATVCSACFFSSSLLYST